MNAWESRGYVEFPAFVSEGELVAHERLCESIVEKFYAESGGRHALGRRSNMAGLTEPRYFDSRADLVAFLELIADERILHAIRSASGHEPIFHNTQFFFEQPPEDLGGETWDGDWHRDTQFDARDDADEQARIASYTGAHFRIAFAHDPWLEIVPGSHARWDTPDELRLRRSGGPGEMAGAEPLVLDRGDALLFHAWSIHRGRYRPQPNRRTLDIIYGWPGRCEFAAPPVTCFRDRAILNELSAGARSFFSRFVDAYVAP